MTQPAWSDPAWALDAAARLVAAPRPEVLSTLQPLMDEVLPAGDDRLVAMLTGDCSRAPLKRHGGSGLEAAPTSAELAQLAGRTSPGAPWVGVAPLAGTERPILAVASSPPGSGGALLAIVLRDDAPDPEAVRVARGLCDVVVAAMADRAADVPPSSLVDSLAASQERARTIAELGDAHEATLAALLGTLRARDVDDRTARAAAVDVAVAALIELREAGHRDRALSEEPADKAFERLAEELGPLTRFGSATLELVGPEDDRALPADLAHAARAISRGVALVLLDQDAVGRIRLGWRVQDDALVLVARDDGPGAITRDALAVHRTAERVAALDATLDVDATPGWGTTVTVRVPLAAVAAREAGPLAALGERELQVLAELTRGARNREIAETLSVTDHTVKFHVANVLRKLDVRSRGEAAALAREHGLGAAAPRLRAVAGGR
ncbi:LuxR C-terminal-related transcriptional regulator [Patulibacter minatonensis]|uniref:LuxR C-terminal-related transcriptional regulator n=1 Tax=Patulibacter minatonensis TaxID=298163 RepID=UPI0004BB0D37|nr:LuxR C-terminal-related transcriptional regulator [Patulibacter minatonensis]